MFSVFYILGTIPAHDVQDLQNSLQLNERAILYEAEQFVRNIRIYPLKKLV